MATSGSLVFNNGRSLFFPALAADSLGDFKPYLDSIANQFIDNPVKYHLIMRNFLQNIYIKILNAKLIKGTPLVEKREALLRDIRIAITDVSSPVPTYQRQITDFLPGIFDYYFYITGDADKSKAPFHFKMLLHKSVQNHKGGRLRTRRYRRKGLKSRRRNRK